jgi:hypothetical protein
MMIAQMTSENARSSLVCLLFVANCKMSYLVLFIVDTHMGPLHVLDYSWTMYPYIWYSSSADNSSLYPVFNIFFHSSFTSYLPSILRGVYSLFCKMRKMGCCSCHFFLLCCFLRDLWLPLTHNKFSCMVIIGIFKLFIGTKAGARMPGRAPKFMQRKPRC